MKLQEYQSKKLFADAEIPISESTLCYNISEAVQAYRLLKSTKAIVKAQVLTGGRGKAGGIKLAQNENELKEHVHAILGMDIKGFVVDCITVGEATEIASEYYLSLTIDRNTRSVVLITSKEGGVDIEDVARNSPEKICRFVVDSDRDIPDFLSRRAAFSLFEDITLVKQTAIIIQKLYKLFIETDASLAEINPLVLTTDRKIIALDAKMSFDPNALYRHPEIESLYEPNSEEKKELFAKSNGFSFIGLGGDIGCMVNGAGLAMATLDMIKMYGGSPANFLDIGGSSNPNKVIEAMKLLLEDGNVKVVLINIFGGITRCDDVAKGLIQAFEQLQTNVPIVIRLAGTNEKEGRELLRGTQFHIAETMDEATRIAVDFN